jgi:hypothetical protein
VACVNDMCCAVASIPAPEQVTADTPLRLGVAAAIAFPDGSMTTAGLRREVFVLDPIADEDLARVWTKRGTSWRHGAVIKRVGP